MGGRRLEQGDTTMSHTPHELHEEFPELAETIHRLKVGDAHFAGLAEAYHTLNRTIHRMEAGVEAVADPVLEDFKKQRLAMKDEIAARLAAV
jgi:uncharacterized protein